MLNSIYEYALENRELLLGALDNDIDKILNLARQNWNTFEPTHNDTPKTLGIDGSYNIAQYQGIDLWIATSVASRPDGKPEIVIRPKIGFERDARPREIMHKLEIEACIKSVTKAELILMDGSLLAGLIAGDGESRKSLIKLVQDNKNQIVFVSKTSDVNHEFDAMAGDIYYYNKASSECGFSNIVEKKLPNDGLIISSTYIRLAHSAPLIKIEMFGEIKNSDIKELIAKLCEQSIGGYPSALRQAHNLCTITDEDINKIVMIIGAHGIVGSREVLH